MLRNRTTNLRLRSVEKTKTAYYGTLDHPCRTSELERARQTTTLSFSTAPRPEAQPKPAVNIGPDFVVLATSSYTHAAPGPQLLRRGTKKRNHRSSSTAEPTTGSVTTTNCPPFSRTLRIILHPGSKLQRPALHRTKLHRTKRSRPPPHPSALSLTSESFSMHTRRRVRPPSCSGGGRDLALAALASAAFCLLSAELADLTSFTWDRIVGTRRIFVPRAGE